MDFPDAVSEVMELQKSTDRIFGIHPLDHVEPFLEFNEGNSKQLSKLLQQFSSAGKDAPSETLTAAQKLRAVIKLALDLIVNQKVNPSLVKLALGIFLTHSKEAHELGVVAPSIKHHAEFRGTKEVHIPLSNPVTADTMNGVEILAYFREDYDFNDHHYHWHLVYPYAGIVQDGQHRRAIDRQGELFLYMHSQMIARYNAELLSWGLNMTHAWGYDDVLTFGYTPVPSLRSMFGARPPFQGWFEDHSPKIPSSQVDGFPPKKDLIRWRNNIMKAIEDGFFYTMKSNGEAGKFLLTEKEFMNWVGIVVEAENPELQEVSPKSGEYIDRALYGNLHNLGHDKFAEIGYHQYTSDKNDFGVMISNIGSPRDPCFWLWHRHIDDFHQEVVKKFVHSLDKHQPDVKILDLKIVPRDENSETPAGGLATFLGPPQLKLNEANAKLSHEPYKWELTVESFRSTPPDKSHPQMFTVRLFIAPKVLIQDQRAWIEMDKFTHTLTAITDTITRIDTVSSVARRTPKEGETLSAKCLCGWPQNMMLPVGTPEGMPYVAFAMLTKDELAKSGTQALSFCGASDDKYPDPRGMGYPFDKTWASRANSTASVPEIIKKLPHTKLCEFKIYRYTKLYQDTASPPPTPGNITWEKDVKDFFTQRDVSCMKFKFDLSKKDDVVLHAGEIYSAVKSHMMPHGEDPWSDDKVAKFKQWMDDGTP